MSDTRKRRLAASQTSRTHDTVYISAYDEYCHPSSNPSIQPLIRAFSRFAFTRDTEPTNGASGQRDPGPRRCPPPPSHPR
eukprot:scaffold6068_cov119-Isochrysis_galbana.AAC.10